MDESYEIWDRYAGNLVLDFPDRASALDFVRRQLDGLPHSAVHDALDRFALELIRGDTIEVLAQGDALLDLLR